jgi:murein DD-endopeptidase MepM/ murein hydrolase activator NlpD
MFFSYRFFDSPKEKQYIREIENLRVNYNLLNKRLELIDAVLTDLQRRDDNVYRAIFEAEPIPAAVRLSGLGGVNRYKKYEGFNQSALIIAATRKADQISKQIVIQSKSYDQLFELVKRKDELMRSIPAIMPVNVQDLMLLASGFGMRTDPIYKTLCFHAGMDFVTEPGKPIYATGDGIVVRADDEASGYGNHVRIEHGFGYLTLYAHMQKIMVKAGAKVKRGQIIGLVGSTGKSVGPHLHYEVHKNGEPVDPVNYYYSDLSPAEYNRLIQTSANPSQSFD